METSFKKGLFFEDYFKNNLTNAFKILKSPPPYSKEYDEENLRPDFLIKHIKTNSTCFIECKYQKIHDHLRKDEIAFFDLNENQFNRFHKQLEEENIPIMYLIGCYSQNKLKEMYLINIKLMDLMLLTFEIENQKFKSMNNFEKQFLKELF